MNEVQKTPLDMVIDAPDGTRVSMHIANLVQNGNNNRVIGYVHTLNIGDSRDEEDSEIIDSDYREVE